MNGSIHLRISQLRKKNMPKAKSSSNNTPTPRKLTPLLVVNRRRAVTAGLAFGFPMFVVLVKHVLLILQFPPIFRLEFPVLLVTQQGNRTQSEAKDSGEDDDNENGVVWKIRVDRMLVEEAGRGVRCR